MDRTPRRDAPRSPAGDPARRERPSHLSCSRPYGNRTGDVLHKRHGHRRRAPAAGYSPGSAAAGPSSGTLDHMPAPHIDAEKFPRGAGPSIRPRGRPGPLPACPPGENAGHPVPLGNRHRRKPRSSRASTVPDEATDLVADQAGPPRGGSWIQSLRSPEPRRQLGPRGAC